MPDSLNRTQAAQLFKNGRKLKSEVLTVYLLSSENPGKLIISINKRLGGAVERNKMRRKLKEAYRLVHTGKTRNMQAAIVLKESIVSYKMREIADIMRTLVLGGRKA